jgi:hypothetical protein
MQRVRVGQLVELVPRIYTPSWGRPGQRGVPPVVGSVEAIGVQGVLVDVGWDARWFPVQVVRYVLAECAVVREAWTT